MKGVYQQLFSKLGLTLSGNVVAAILAYVVMTLSFPLLIQDPDPQKMLWRATAVGLVVYATYGFTLSAILPGYGLNLALTETVWGMFLYTMATLVTQYLTSN
jgi:uncharacterized membrane protein